jgi:hypothetical protein
MSFHFLSNGRRAEKVQLHSTVNVVKQFHRGHRDAVMALNTSEIDDKIARLGLVLGERDGKNMEMQLTENLQWKFERLREVVVGKLVQIAMSKCVAAINIFVHLSSMLQQQTTVTFHCSDNRGTRIY